MRDGIAIRGIFSGHKWVSDSIKALNMPLQDMDIKLAKLTSKPQIVNPDKFSCSLLSSFYQTTTNYAITGSADKVEIFVKIDM